ncbi:MAG TPA: ABC transporter substrate-binding protein [Candidatus Limnocylindrales bacterium]|nr:ABC transporter substrate-binding protein [Candidatus Limnocylindrales bacterium]
MESSASPRRRGLLLSLVASAGLVFAACSGSTASPSSAASAPPASAGGSTAASAPASGGTVTLPAPEKKTLKIGLSTGGEASQYAEYLAQQLDFYKKYGGFDSVEVSGLQGDAKVVQALVAGGLDMGVLGVSSAISSQTTDTPLKVVSLNGVTLTDMLVCGKDVKAAADVKGKTVAVSTFGGTSHGSVIILLSQLGLTANDVTITQVGNQDARLAAVKAGSVACAPIDLAQKDAVTQAGLSIITDNKSSGKQWGRSGLAATADFISKNPNTVLGVVASALAAQNYMFTNTDDAAAKFAEYSQQSADDAKGIIEDFTTWGDRSMDWTDDAFNYPKEVLAAVNPQMKDVDVTTAYDKTFLQKLNQMGFYDAIGDPEKPTQ